MTMNRIEFRAAAASSAADLFTLFDPRVPVAERRWGSESRRPSWAEGLFAGRSPTSVGLHRVTGFNLPWAGSDMTVQHARIIVRLRLADGGYRDVENIRSATIGRGLDPSVVDFSNDHPMGHPARRELKTGWKKRRRALKPLERRFAVPIEAMGIQVFMEGHGWFGAQGLEVFGEYLEGAASYVQLLMDTEYGDAAVKKTY